MNAIQLLREQFASAHETMEGTMADVTNESAHFTQVGKALPVGAAYAHAVLGEDILMASMVRHTAPLATEAASIGLSQMMPGMDQWEKHDEWARTVQVDLPKFKEYAQKVYKATDDYLTTLKDEDLDNEVEIPGMGKKTLAFLLTNFFLLHTANLTGEVSAAKGVQGLKGYPW